MRPCSLPLSIVGGGSTTGIPSLPARMGGCQGSRLLVKVVFLACLPEWDDVKVLGF